MYDIFFWLIKKFSGPSFAGCRRYMYATVSESKHDQYVSAVFFPTYSDYIVWDLVF